MNLQGKKIITEDNREFLIIETINFKGNTYVYMVNKDNELDAMFGFVNLSDELTIDSINPKIFEQILPLFIKKFSES